MKKLKLLLDIDEVVCFSGYLELLNEYLGSNYSIDDFTEYYLEETVLKEEELPKFYEFIRDKEQYKNPVYLPGAIEAIERLSKYYEIYPCSDCRNPFDLKYSGRIFSGKFDLLYNTFSQEIIPAKNYILTGSKDVFKGDAQIDDLVKSLTGDIELKILFPSYHNKNIDTNELNKLNIVKSGDDYKVGWIHAEKILTDYAIKKLNI